MSDAPPAAEGQRPARIDALTGLRILPALLVLLSHLRPPPWAGPHLKTFLASGYGGVTVFFVLSGFVLTHNYFERFAHRPGLRTLVSYFVARLARVYPLYLLILVWVSFPGLWLGKANVSLWLEHALGLQAWSGKLDEVYRFNPPGWSISVELFLYACFPLLVFLLLPALRRPRRIGGSLLLVVALMAATTFYFQHAGYADLAIEDPRSAHRWLYRHPLCRLGDFLLGMLAARLVATLPRVPARALQWGAALSTASLVGIMCWPAHLNSAASWDLSLALPAAVLIFCLAAAPASLASRWLATKPMLLMGEASYALYLCHYGMLRRLNLGKLPPDAWLPATALTILFAVVFAIGLHIAIERPARELLRAWLDPLAPGRVTARRVPAPAARGAELGGPEPAHSTSPAP